MILHFVFRLLTKFFDQYAMPNMHMLDIAPELTSFNALPLIQLQGCSSVISWWMFHLKLIPDICFTLEDIILKVHPLTNESQIIGRAVMKGTKVFDDDLPPVVQQLCSYVQRDHMHLHEDAHGRIHLLTPPYNEEETEVVMTEVASEVLDFINTPLDASVFMSNYNLARPLAKPMNIEIYGEFRLFMNSSGKIYKGEFLSQEACGTFRKTA